jgi:type I restriction enzyme, S subunit
MSRYKAYPEYKDSRVEWLGQTPKDWKLCRLKDTSVINPSKLEVRNLGLETEVSFIPMEAIGENGELDISRTKQLTEVISGYSYVADGDVMIAKITPCFENGKGAIAKGLTNKIGFATTEIINIRPRSPTDSGYFYYLLSADPFRKLAEGSMYGAGGQKRVADNFVAEYHLSLPSQTERGKIASFLDHETAKIDALIEKQRRLIELLKEKRQAVISHAVTKGLDPNAPMKDSGVEWLGAVPAHWDVAKIKHLTVTFDQGWSPQCDARPAEGNEFGVLKVGCVNGGVFNPEENKALPPELKPQTQYKLKKSDLLISRANTRDLVGSAAVVHSDFDKLILCDKLYRLRFPCSINPELIAFYLSLSVVRQQIELGTAGASDSMQNISQSVIKDLVVLVPPEPEANRLVKEIEKRIKNFDTTLKKVGLQISLLQERRTALISAAVTGKIDVRDWQAAA